MDEVKRTSYKGLYELWSSKMVPVHDRSLQVNIKYNRDTKKSYQSVVAIAEAFC